MRVRVTEHGPWLCLVCGEEAVRLAGGPLELTWSPEARTLHVRLQSLPGEERHYATELPRGLRAWTDADWGLTALEIEVAPRP